jgi:hypothetical protein
MPHDPGGRYLVFSGALYGYVISLCSYVYYVATSLLDPAWGKAVNTQCRTRFNSPTIFSFLCSPSSNLEFTTTASLLHSTLVLIEKSKYLSNRTFRNTRQARVAPQLHHTLNWLERMIQFKTGIAWGESVSVGLFCLSTLMAADILLASGSKFRWEPVTFGAGTRRVPTFPRPLLQGQSVQEAVQRSRHSQSSHLCRARNHGVSRRLLVS